MTIPNIQAALAVTMMTLVLLICAKTAPKVDGSFPKPQTGDIEPPDCLIYRGDLYNK